MDDITVALSPQELDYVFRTLYTRPYGEVANLISKMQAQVQGQRPPKQEKKDGSSN